MTMFKSTISKSIELSLRLIGIWPKSSYTVLRRVFWFVTLGMCVICQVWYCISSLKSADLRVLMDAMSLTVSNIVIFLKLMIIWCNYRVFHNILTIILDDWNNYSLTSQCKQVMLDKAILSNRISNFLVGSYLMTCVFYLISALFIKDDTDEELASNEKKFLLKMSLPFQVTISPLYEIFIMIQFAFEFTVTFIASTLMALYAALALHVGGQINIIYQKFIDFSSINEKDTQRELKCLVAKHQRIINLSNDIRHLFTYISLVQFLADTLVICCLGFVVVTSIGTEEGPTILAKCFPYYVGVNCEAFILCYTSEYLTLKSINIDEAAYNIPWYELEPQDSRILMLLLMRSKKPVKLTAGKFLDISLETFASMYAEIMAVMGPPLEACVLTNKLKMREKEIRNTISYSVKCGLHFVGIWPGTPWPGVHKVFWVTFTLLFQVFQYKYIISYFKTVSLEDMIDTLSLTAAFGLTFIKLIVAWKNHSALRYILSTMEKDCKKYAVMDTNNIISKTGSLSYRITTLIILVYLLSGVLYGVGFACQPTNHSLPRELLLKMDFPFDTTVSPIYELVITMQFLHQTTCASTFGIFSGLLVMVILHIGCQVDIMCQALSNIANGSKKQLRFFINRHQEIINFTEKTEELFTYIALSQLVSNTIITCCLGFLMVVSLGNENGLPVFIKSVMFYTVCSFEAFIFCFAGEYLNIKSELIGETAYKTLWYDLHPNESKLLILLIVRSQKGFPFTFGKFSNLSLESFTAIMKASVSYMSVLLAMT
ncbi:uncharacterized protein LOC143180057 [Calliopsis andreniformis]|uniref:uncharacterized protein LOC143180057 n=1 Tax=Calliopsis andreniformis TaxID=337506 RepID=UPI003FCD12D3